MFKKKRKYTAFDNSLRNDFLDFDVLIQKYFQDPLNFEKLCH